MGRINLTSTVQARAEAQARREGQTCKVCGSSDLVSRDTGLRFGDEAVTVYLDCAPDETHETGASVQSAPQPAPPGRNPGETAPRA